MEESILSKIEDIYKNKCKKPIIYIDGDNGVGKTHLVKQILKKKKEWNPLWYSSINNNDIIDILSNKYSSNISILSYFKKYNIKNIIIIDDFLYNIQIHKTLLTTIIQYIKCNNKYIPVIIINNLIVNKKINYIKKYSSVFTVNTPDISILKHIIIKHIPDISTLDICKLIKISKHNLCKLLAIIPFYNVIQEQIDIKYNNLIIINTLLTHNTLLNDYYKIISDSDRTSLSLIYHENCIQLFSKNIVLYSSILDNFTIADYLDRYIYQKQLWELSQWTNLIKLFYSNNLIKDKSRSINISFTKILTNYAIEYSNKNYIIRLCKQYNCKKNELIYYITLPSERLLKLYTNS
tara:strand:+ start:5684 stop:6733 length:1050 start_codon:yes stop_codon:yes gene_type:complete